MNNSAREVYIFVVCFLLKDVSLAVDYNVTSLTRYFVQQFDGLNLVFSIQSYVSQSVVLKAKMKDEKLETDDGDDDDVHDGETVCCW